MDAVERAIADTRVCMSWNTEACAGGRLVELPGVSAGLLATTPDRSLFNWIVYSDAEALRRELPDLQRTFEDSGVRAFTVWVPERDLEIAKWLADRGHVLDATPMAMELDLDGFEPPDPGDLDWRRVDAVGDFAAINDSAYPFADTPFADAFSAFPSDSVYCAWLDGEAAACAVLIDHEDRVVVNAVATRPSAQRRGLSSRLLGVALAEAAARGQRYAALEATKAGQPVYERLGFEPVCELQMWEHRV